MPAITARSRPPCRRIPATARGQLPPRPLLRQFAAKDSDSNKDGWGMTEDEALARAAGLGDKWQGRGAEITEAIAHARRLAGAFARPADETAEPIPAYAVPAPKAAR